MPLTTVLFGQQLSPHVYEKVHYAAELNALTALCRHCLLFRDQHANNDKCLYQPTTFEAFPFAEQAQRRFDEWMMFQP